MRKIITVIEVNNVMEYPPVISLLENLLSNNHYVYFIGYGCPYLPNGITRNCNFNSMELSLCESGDSGRNIIAHATTRKKLCSEARKLVKESMMKSELIWTTSAQTVRILGDDLLKYKHIMQLMELTKYGYWYKKIIKYPIDKYARHAWKTVVPEINRAYIQKTWWSLDKTPYVLPNKPYCLEPGEPTSEMLPLIDKMEKEKRKVILYLGGIWPDRELEHFAVAVNRLGEDYCLYVIGKAYGEEANDKLKYLIDQYKIEYLGTFLAPKHLIFLKYAYIGLLPYKPTAAGLWSELNALYCAPNKIYEYAGFGIPMIGTDVLGLKFPFEKYNIGFCCKSLDVKEIISSIKHIESKYKKMSDNCYKFYNDINLDEIVNSILQDEQVETNGSINETF